MSKYICLFLSLFFSASVVAAANDSVNIYRIPDSVKPVNFISTVQATLPNGIKKFSAGIRNRRSILIPGRQGKNFKALYLSYPAEAK